MCTFCKQNSKNMIIKQAYSHDNGKIFVLKKLTCFFYFIFFPIFIILSFLVGSPCINCISTTGKKCVMLFLCARWDDGLGHLVVISSKQ